MDALQSVRSLVRPTRALLEPSLPAGGGVWEAGRGVRRSEPRPDLGVHLPFLSPMLCGVRLRVGMRGAEFVLPNPSGGRGVYIAEWAVVAGFAAPSLHDSLLVSRLSALDRIGPSVVRQAALSVALDGHAGADAAEAARAARRAGDVAALRLRAQFLMRLAWLAGLREPAAAARCLDRDGFSRLAGRLGWSGRQLAEALEGVSEQHATIALGGGHGRWGRMLALLHRLRISLAEQQFHRHNSDGPLLGRIIAAAERRIREAARLLPQIDALLADPMTLLEAWRDGARFAGAEWLAGLEAAFDGWDRACLLWFDAATPTMRQELIPEIAALTGAGAGDGWTGGRDAASMPAGPDGAASERHRRLLARNQRVRAQELAFELEVA